MPPLAHLLPGGFTFEGVLFKISSDRAGAVTQCWSACPAFAMLGSIPSVVKNSNKDILVQSDHQCGMLASQAKEAVDCLRVPGLLVIPGCFQSVSSPLFSREMLGPMSGVSQSSEKWG